MNFSAKKFVKDRPNPIALTQKRINEIFIYIHYCYTVLVSEEKKYSRRWIKENTKDQVENYVKKRLVHDYLKKQKKHYPTKLLIEDILFECEPEMPYSYYDPGKQINIEANDKIDIKINHLGLQEVWKNTDEQDIYLAIECKIIKNLSDNVHYQKDIQKFSDRKHLQFRLPIEGMIGLKETKSLTTSKIVNDLNNRLASCPTIKTTRFLSSVHIHDSMDLYSSKHLRTFDMKSGFSISHLYLDFSDTIIV